MPRYKFINLTGVRYGKLTAVAYAGCFVIPARMLPAWRCVCDCGKEKIIPEDRLKRGGATSCGCNRATHGESSHVVGGVTPENEAWRQMKSRCFNENHASYERYGGRGITVCERWKDSFENFLADMGRRPSDEHSIERKNNNGNYEPGNCVWATRAEQQSNTRQCVYLTVNGVRDTISGWCRRTGIPLSTLCQRIEKGWAHSDAVIPFK